MDKDFSEFEQIIKEKTDKIPPDDETGQLYEKMSDLIVDRLREYHEWVRS